MKEQRWELSFASVKSVEVRKCRGSNENVWPKYYLFARLGAYSCVTITGSEIIRPIIVENGFGGI